MPPITFPSLGFLRTNKKPPPQDITQYYLSSNPHSQSYSPYQDEKHVLLPNNAPALRPVPPPSSPTPIPSSQLIFSLTHPPLDLDTAPSRAASFFLACIPDPIGFLYHSAKLINDHLSLDTYTSISGGDGRAPGSPGGVTWRHQLIQLVLENEDGLAATSGGRIAVSLKWVGDVMRTVEKGERNMQGATKEFKGVLLHELVHTIQHDGFGSTPVWLTESVADYVRLRAFLDPPHWRKPGAGKPEQGWEEGYDIGARFLSWLVGEGYDNDPAKASGELVRGFGGLALHTPTSSWSPTATSAAEATATKYPSPPPTAQPPHPFPQPGSAHAPAHRDRPGPWPELIKLLDARLTHERYSSEWWEEMTALPLHKLWEEYLAYHR